MHTAELFFHRRPRTRMRGEPIEAIQDVLRALERNGQLVPDVTCPDVETRDGFRVFVLIPEATSLRRSRYNQKVHEAIHKLDKCGLKAPTVRVLGRSLDSHPVCRCARPESLILSTSFLTCELPLSCGTCAGIVPFYRFSPTFESGTYEDIIFWCYHYRAFDSIWIASGPGERLAYRELSRSDSELTKAGLDVCRTIEKSARRPVYYYLQRYYGRSVVVERKRCCPACDGTWLLKQPWHDRFDFRCRRCRLLSNIAFDVR